jgi:hypothetical protein
MVKTLFSDLTQSLREAKAISDGSATASRRFMVGSCSENLRKIEIESVPCDGLVVLIGKDFVFPFAGQIWARCKSRKAGTCCATGIDFDAGTIVYRPKTNGRNRRDRILASHIEKLVYVWLKGKRR